MSSTPKVAAATISLTLDCADPERLATFWMLALRYTRLGAVDNFVVLGPNDPAGPKLALQGVLIPTGRSN